MVNLMELLGITMLTILPIQVWDGNRYLVLLSSLDLGLLSTPTQLKFSLMIACVELLPK